MSLYIRVPIKDICDGSDANDTGDTYIVKSNKKIICIGKKV